MSDRAPLDVHQHCRELISGRLDGTLTLEQDWALTLHLLACATCCGIERDFAAQRQALRALPASVPPRDLWARTSAALDREMVAASRRRSGRIGDPSDPRRLPGTLMVSLVSVGMAAALVLSQLVPGQVIAPEDSAGRPTPFSVPGQAIAYVGADPIGLTVYRTTVDRACPSVASDCYRATAAVPARVSFPTSFEPSNVVMSPNGDRLAISGWDHAREDVFGVVVMPPLEDSDLLGPQASRSPSGIGAGRPTVSPSPLATASASPRPAITAMATSPTGELIMISILEDVRGVGSTPAWSADGQTLAFSAMPADLRHGPDLYVWQVGDQRARPMTDDHGSYFASWAGEHVVISRVVPRRLPNRPFEDPTDFDAPVQVQTVVVEPNTGNELVLEGPDLWLPQVNAGRTHAAGWHGTLVRDGAAVVPATGALYMVAWPDIGQFPVPDQDPPADEPGEEDNEAPSPSAVPDSAPSPSAAPDAKPTPDTTADASVAPTPEPTADPGAGDEETAAPKLTLPPAIEGATPPADASPAPTGASAATPGADSSVGPSETPEAAPSADPDATSDPLQTAAPTEPVAAPTAVATARLMPIEPERHLGRHPVLSWRLLWSADGAVLGFWVADAPASSWGELAVLAFDSVAGQLNHLQPILPPTLARRGFTVGLNRVVWAAPVEGVRGGELRVRFWGPDGFGDLRMVPPTGVVGAL